MATWLRTPVVRLSALLVGVAGFSTGGVDTASADGADEARLADRFAPVVRLVRQKVPCGPGEPFRPSDVNAFLGNDGVALRGPWASDDLVAIGPTADDLSTGLVGYHLDFPGNPLQPGCDYEEWARTVTEGTAPTVYAHVDTEPDSADRLSLQYWFYYPFNDYNNTHESDWEMVQLEFGAPDATSALGQNPVLVAYSQHEGAEKASWGDPKLDIVSDTHPVVHPAAGSHANYFGESLYLGRSGQQGFGCDDTRAPTVDVRPVVRLIPSDPAEARAAFPWIGYEGSWGQREEAFYNGPTGPNEKPQWVDPFEWSRELGRDQSYAVPAGGVFGTAATDLFCQGVATGSDAVRTLANHPGASLVVLALVSLSVAWLMRRTVWRPTAPLRVFRRRAWGQTIAAAARMYAAHPMLFAGIGVPAIAGTAVSAVLRRASITAAEEGSASAASLWSGLGSVAIAMMVVFLLVFVQAAAIRAVLEIDAGREVTARRAYGLAAHLWPALLGTLALVVLVVGLLLVTVVLSPLALIAGVLFALWVPSVQVEGLSPVAAIRRSTVLVRHRVVRVALLIALANVVAVVVGALLGALLILAAGAPFAFSNLVAGVVYALLLPFVAITTMYIYADAVVRDRLAASTAGGAVLPPEMNVHG